MKDLHAKMTWERLIRYTSNHEGRPPLHVVRLERDANTGAMRGIATDGTRLICADVTGLPVEWADGVTVAHVHRACLPFLRMGATVKVLDDNRIDCADREFRFDYKFPDYPKVIPDADSYDAADCFDLDVEGWKVAVRDTDCAHDFTVPVYMRTGKAGWQMDKKASTPIMRLHRDGVAFCAQYGVPDKAKVTVEQRTIGAVVSEAVGVDWRLLRDVASGKPVQVRYRDAKMPVRIDTAFQGREETHVIMPVRV